ARAGRGAVVEALLNGAKPDERRQIDMPDARGSTPLMLAIHNGRPEIARALLAAGAQVDAINAQGETALSEAAYAAEEDLAEQLLQQGAKPDTLDRYGKAPICYAGARGATRLVARLLDAGVDPDARYGGQLTALMWAAGFPDITPADHAAATVRLLIARHAKPDLVDDRGRSALMIAAALNRFETARVLIEAGADKSLRDKQGKSAADLAPTEEMRTLLR
ncbi:MAG: ankyrin repeat domain-containing protein, partial [Pseudomonadota bacterium]|nr:ankyrin repeat domain-containing protein [Pseudomonadota bacterium]